VTRLLSTLAALACVLVLAPVALIAPAAGAVRSATDRPGAERLAVERAGADRSGVQRPWVAKAQRALNGRGCLAGRPDGRVDRQVRAAVVRFQSRLGRQQTGRLDARTRRALHAEDAARCDRRPIPRGTGKGRRIVVSQQQNWIWLVGPKGGVAAQGGMVDNPRVLRPGVHRTGSYCGRAARIRLNQDYSGRQWLDNFVRFAPCGVGFHRIPRHKSTGRQIHADWLLGTDLATSHGCLRLSRQLSQRVWRFTARTTSIHVT